MDRSVVAAYAFVMLPLGALLGSGCDSRGGRDPAVHTDTPAILAELGKASPGPWRRIADAPVVTEEGDAARIDERIADARLEPSPQASAPNEPLVDGDNETSVAVGATDDEAAGNVTPERRTTGSTLQFSGSPDGADDTEGGVVPVDSRREPAEPKVNDGAASENGAFTPWIAQQSPTVNSQPARPTAEEAERSVLPWSGPQARTPEMTAAVRRADQRVGRGFELAERGALYSARSEFIAALQIIATANDTGRGTQFYSKALSAGLRAVEESSDFVRQNPRKSETETGSLVARHATPVLKNIALEQVAPMAAANRYYTFAQEQLAAAGASEVTGSLALFGLGKVALASRGNQGMQTIERTSQAIVMFQAAVLADSRNFRAANELGVLLAETGNLTRARTLLLESARQSNEPVTWNNLAIVHARLGENQLAQQAKAQAVSLGLVSSTSGAPQVQWLDPTAFAGTSSVTDDSVRPAAANTPQPASTTEKPATTTAKKGVTDWLPWSARR